MGEFQRSRSKVWWSNLEADTEDERVVGWGGAGHVLSPSRGSSSSPSSSHKSQDSGFSDSEASSSPPGSGEPFKPSPLPSQEPECNVTPAQDPQDVTGLQQDCACPQAENTVSEEPGRVRPKSPASKLKEQLFSQCACLGETSRNDERDSTLVKAAGQIVDNSELSLANVEYPEQLPVKKLREKFLQDCMCLNQAPESNLVPECPNKSQSKPTSPLRTEKQRLAQPSSEECTRADTGNVSEQYLQQRQDHKELSVKETSSKADERVNLVDSPAEHSSQIRSQSSLNRSIPLPTIWNPQRNAKESPSKSVRDSPSPSPRSQKIEYPSHLYLNTNTPSPTWPSAEDSNDHHSPIKEAKENTNLSVQTVASQGGFRHQRTPPVTSRSPKSLSQRSPGGESIAQSSRAPSNREDSPVVKPLCSELPEHLGSPTHTSTPKTSSATSPVKLLVTPNRPHRCPGSGKKNGRPVNLLENFNR